VKIGVNSVIANGAVVVSDVPADSIVGGVPAKIIGKVTKKNAE
jgi:acetyltransferase-like isoleucine patch superfamily enzyme